MERPWPQLKVVIGLALISVLAYRYLDVEMVVDQFAAVRLPWLALAALLITQATLLGALSAYLLAGRGNEISWRAFLPRFWMAWAVGLVVPGQIGDVATLSATLRRHGMTWHASIGRVLLDKAISFLVILAVGVAGIAHVLRPADRGMSNFGWLAVALLPVFLLVLWYRRNLWVLLDSAKPGFIGTVLRTMKEMLAIATRQPGRVAINFIVTIVKTIITGLAYLCMFAAFGQVIPEVWAVIALAAASSLVAYVPVSFNGIGTVEVTGILLFSQLGVPASTVLSVYLALRLLVLLLAWTPASLWLVFDRKQADETV